MCWSDSNVMTGVKDCVLSKRTVTGMMGKKPNAIARRDTTR